ncbi:hypothetical protein ACJ65_01580 [Kocuria rhizophila]|nr:hypothetical protein ACJ65_01580 [Kocuria rhizophila]
MIPEPTFFSRILRVLARSMPVLPAIIATRSSVTSTTRCVTAYSVNSLMTERSLMTAGETLRTSSTVVRWSFLAPGIRP